MRSSASVVPARNTCQASTSRPAAGWSAAATISAPIGTVAMAENGMVSIATRVPCAAACSASSRSGAARAVGLSVGGPFSDPILMNAGLRTSAASNRRSRTSWVCPGSPRGIHHRSSSSISVCTSPAWAARSRSLSKPMLSRTATRSSATKPNPQKPASAMAVMRSPIGTGLVPGVSIGEVSPALDHDVATSCGIGFLWSAKVRLSTPSLGRFVDNRTFEEMVTGSAGSPVRYHRGSGRASGW